MRKLLLIFCLVILVGCGGNTPKSKEVKGNEVQKIDSTEDQRLQASIVKAQESPEIETKCFLDFQFGMTESEVDAHLEKLRKNKTIYVKNDTYIYDLTTEAGYIIQVGFTPKYYNGKLFRIGYVFSDDINSKELSVFVCASFMKTDRKKGMRSYMSKDDTEDFNCTFIKDNLIICFTGNIMMYENAPVGKRYNYEQDSIRLQKQQETNANF